MFQPRNSTSKLHIYMEDRQKRTHYIFVYTSTSSDRNKTISSRDFPDKSDQNI
jgi:hypothetical protein